MVGWHGIITKVLLPSLVLLVSGCSGAEQIYDGGCFIDGGSADAGPCCANQFYYYDMACGAPAADGGSSPCQQVGDLGCYDYCSDSSQCKDPSRPNCSILGLFNSGDWNCNKSVKVCRDKKDDDC
jgi:hypothetical protein